MTILNTNVGSPSTIGGAGGGRVYAYNDLSTTPQEVVGANAFRQSVTFHNPGSTIVYVAPSFVQNTGSDVALAPTVDALGGCFLIPIGGTLTLTGECQKPYQAFVASGAFSPLTVVDSNI